MKADPILEEVWRIKDKLSREMAADPAAYSAKLDEIAKAEEQADGQQPTEITGAVSRGLVRMDRAAHYESKQEKQDDVDRQV